MPAIGAWVDGQRGVGAGKRAVAARLADLLDASAGGKDDRAVVERRGARGLEADGSAKQHLDRLVLGDRHHIDSRSPGSIDRPQGASRVDDAVAVVGPAADIHLDVEQALIHVHRQALGRDIGRRSRAHRAALLDPRSDQRDIVARIDVGPGLDLDLRSWRRPQSAEGEARSRPVEVGRAIVVEVRDGRAGQQQAADVEHRRRTDEDSAGTVEPDVAAGGFAVLDLADHRPVESDRPRRIDRVDPVEHGVVGRVRAVDEGRDIARGKEVDRSRPLRGVERRPVDHRLSGIDGDRFRARARRARSRTDRGDVRPFAAGRSLEGAGRGLGMRLLRQQGRGGHRRRRAGHEEPSAPD